MKTKKAKASKGIERLTDSHSDYCRDCVLAIANRGGESLGAEVFESAHEEDLFEVWLTRCTDEEACRMLWLTETDCLPQAELIACAVGEFVKTREGRQQAVEYVRHRLNHDEAVDVARKLAASIET